jgi:hypothetical protein
MLHFAQERTVKAMDPRAPDRSSATRWPTSERAVETPQDLLEFSEFMLRVGGLVTSVGQSLKTKALLRGARERRE